MFVFMLIGLLTIVTSLFAQDRENIELLAELHYESWGDAEDLVVRGNYAYIVGNGGGLRIVHLERRIMPEEVGYIRIGGQVYGLDIFAGKAYVAVGRNGVKIIDVSNLHDPENVAVVEDIGNVQGLSVGEGLMVTASGSDGIYILDVTNPEEVEILSILDTPGFALRAEIVGRHAFIADREGGLRIIDISDPAEPVEIGSLEPEGETRDVAISVDWAFLAEQDGVSRVDIRELDDPLRTYLYEFDDPTYSLTTDGDYIYCSTGDRGRLEILRDADELRHVGSLNANIQGLAISDDVLYGVGAGINVIDVSDHNSPQIIGANGRILLNRAIEISDGYAFVGTQGYGVRTYDISDIQNPELVYWNVMNRAGLVTDIIIDGELMYSAGYRDSRRLRIENIAEPDNPVLLSEIDVGDYLETISLAGRYLFYTGSSRSGIVDISDPEEPETIAQIDMDDVRFINDIDGQGEFAFITVESEGIRVYDIADPVNNYFIGTYSVENSCYRLNITGDYGYLLKASGMEIIDLSEPDNIRLVGSLEFDWHATGHHVEITVVGNYAYLALSENGIMVVNVSDPESPQVVGHYDTPGTAQAIAAQGNTVFVADFDYLGIYDCAEALSIGDFGTNLQPKQHSLSAFPNPFNSTVSLNFNLSITTQTTIQIYDLSGKLIEGLVNRKIQAGSHNISWAADSYSSGMYFVKMEAEEFSAIRKIILTR